MSDSASLLNAMPTFQYLFVFSNHHAHERHPSKDEERQKPVSRGNESHGGRGLDVEYTLSARMHTERTNVQKCMNSVPTFSPCHAMFRLITTSLPRTFPSGNNYVSSAKIWPRPKYGHNALGTFWEARLQGEPSLDAAGF